MNKHETALSDLKTYLTTPPLLSKPLQGEDLYVYLSVTHHAVSGVLVKEHEGFQSPVYYVNKSLIDAETRYISIENLVLALAMMSKKLRRYFESHRIHVMTNFPLRTVLSKHELMGRTDKWAIRLSLRVVLKSPQGDKVAYSVRCDFKATNNEAEYDALILGLTIAKDMKVPRENNIQTDALAGLGAVFKGLNLSSIPVLHIIKPVIERLAHKMEVLVLNSEYGNNNEVAGGWIKMYKNYLQHRIQPSSNNEAMILRIKASRFTSMDNVLFKKSSTGILQRCLEKHEAAMV
ncbi:uncharacterized protein LOC141674076 [Apium graveolens]|uniref:uncharacterized protein LOC141674076 n=1 Tax=Apium graveolens TaxID=4045 RepID=UPI003D7B405C